MSDWLLFGLGILLTAGTGLFVASEFALVNLDRAVLEGRHDKGEKGLAALIAALRHTSTHLSSAQLGITLTTLLTGYTMEPAVSRLLSGPLAALGLPGDVVRPVGTIVGVVLATLLSMISDDLGPKTRELALPERTGAPPAPLRSAFPPASAPP